MRILRLLKWLFKCAAFGVCAYECVHECVCVYVSACECECMCEWVHVCVCMCMWVLVWVHVCACVCMWVHVWVFGIGTNSHHVYTSSQMCTYWDVCIPRPISEMNLVIVYYTVAPPLSFGSVSSAQHFGGGTALQTWTIHHCHTDLFTPFFLIQ